MASPATFEFTDANFETSAIKSAQPVLVDFWAEWCGPCRAIAPTIDQLATQYQGKVRVGKMDIDRNQKVALQYGVQSIPTILLIKDGQVKQKWVGIVPAATLKQALDSVAG